MTEIPLPLPLKLRKNGFSYTQVLRTGIAYIYMQRVTNDITYFEVFYKRISPEKVIKDKKLPARVKFPNDEAFGVWAWSFPTLDLAIEKFLAVYR